MPRSKASTGLHRTIWYMGAKARVIPGFLETVLEEELTPGGTMVDLMCGTGVVSAFAADRYRVYANDVQGYSACITRSLIEHDPSRKRAFLASLDAARDLGASYQENLEALTRKYRDALEEEARWLEPFADGRRWPRSADRSSWAAGYRAFLSDATGVYPGGDGRDGTSPYRRAASLLSESAVRRRRRDPSLRPACLVTAYYANIYFGLEQAIQIDSLRSAVDALDAADTFREEKRTHYLSALLHAASVTTSGTSHFAQPRHLTKDSELAAMARRRVLSPLAVFEEYGAEIAKTVERTSHRKGNRVFQADYRNLIGFGGAFEFPKRVDLVYLDPPYTADNYSRFYHVLEVIARYDYPELQRNGDGDVVRGRYPVIAKRFQSDFCKKRKVEGAFRSVLDATAAAGAKLVISYAAPTGLLVKHYAGQDGTRAPVGRFEALCREVYDDVQTRRRRMMHSGQGDSNIRIDELLLVCTKPR